MNMRINEVVIKVWDCGFTIFAGLKTREAGGFMVRNKVTHEIKQGTFYEVSL